MLRQDTLHSKGGKYQANFKQAFRTFDGQQKSNLLPLQNLPQLKPQIYAKSQHSMSKSVGKPTT